MQKDNSQSKMDKVKRRFLTLIIGFISMIATFAYIYMIGMSIFEGEEIKYYVAVQKTVESVTTAGFGGHAPWESLGMNIIIIIMNLIGVTLFFFGVPIAIAPIVAPSLKQAIKDRPPRKSDKQNHVIVTGFNDADEVLVNKLRNYNYDCLLIIEDEKKALELQRDGYDVVHGSPEDTDTLKNANVEKSKSIIVDIDDNVNPSIILSANRYGGDTEKISVVDSKNVERYHNLSGADFVLKSRTEFGKALGLRSILNLREEINDVINDLPSTREVIINPDDEVAGKTVREYSDKTEQFVLCGWFNGQFVPGPKPDRKVSGNTILITTSNEENQNSIHHSSGMESSKNIIIAGYGNVGKSVEDTVESKGYNATTIDTAEKGADINGDIKKPDVLEQAGISDAESIVITINDDTDIIYSTLVINEMNPDVEIISRINKEENIWKAYESGADFVISLETLTGDVVANRVIEDSNFIAPTQELQVDSISNDRYSGMKVNETDIGEEYGYIMAIERENGELIGGINGESEIKENDTIILINR